MKRTKDGATWNTFALLEQFDTQNEEWIRSLIRRILFVLLLFVEGLMLLQAVGNSYREGNYEQLVLVAGLEILLTAIEALKFFALKTKKDKTLCYIVDVIVVFALTSIVGNAYLCPLYMLMLTEFYVQYDMVPSVLVCAICMVLFVVTFLLTAMLHNENVSVLSSVTQSFTDFIILFVHFVVVNVAIRFYRQYAKLKTVLKELDGHRQKLQKAYDELEQAAALAERQRIAKDIHDIAGHSITTVIMQTEAAKLIVEENPKEAKGKIVAANLQAKLALKELRESVHLLSGNKQEELLKDALERIIRQSSEGTGVRIRSEICELEVGNELFRLFCNSLKEGISNGIRHGGATAFWFELKRENGKIVFLLSDNGKGALGEKKEGFGLSSMRKSVEGLGGEMKIFTAEDEGFEIRLEIAEEGKNGNNR